jgi:hypothetical protein
MASNPTMYNINNEPLSVKNVIKYLYCLNRNGIIPQFTLNITNTELHIIVIYGYSTTSLPLMGFTNIVYNIYTKKWKSINNIASLIDRQKVDNRFNNIQTNFPFVIQNNLLKINFDNYYVEYIITSDYIEDVLEPSLNLFDENLINPRNMFITRDSLGDMFRYLNLGYFGSDIDLQDFYRKVYEHERYLLFLSKKKNVNETFFLPEELWENVYKYY